MSVVALSWSAAAMWRWMPCGRPPVWCAEAHIVYRRSEAELPARAEEVHHAKQEGIEFRMLTNPVEVLGDEKGWVRGLRCVRMELGEPDASGRRSPVAVEGSEFEIGCDVVIMALGTVAQSADRLDDVRVWRPTAGAVWWPTRSTGRPPARVSSPEETRPDRVRPRRYSPW